MKKLLCFALLLSFALTAAAQRVAQAQRVTQAKPVNYTVSYTFKEPLVKINFGTGEIGDRSAGELSNYRFVPYSCPTDGHYTYTSATGGCFRGDWVTLPEDHTPGDADGNMMLVNAAPSSGTFFNTAVNRLKGATTYEFSVWMLNVCRPTDKCPFPLLPDIAITLKTQDGKIVAQLGTGELIRRDIPQWTKYEVIFTTPASETPLTLTMSDKAPGGCGNDFALDDISFRERIEIRTPIPTKTPPVTVKKTPAPPVVKSTPKKPEVTTKENAKTPLTAQATPKTRPTTPLQKNGPAPLQDKPELVRIALPKPDSAMDIKPKPVVLPRPPAVVTTRANPLVRLIETPPGEIKIDLYDNGQIDGDTVSVYHNNVLLVSHARLEVTPITFRIAVDAAHPHHEIVLVAHNLGSIPPNTSLMVVNAGGKLYEVFISSTEQKNAKVVIDLKN